MIFPAGASRIRAVARRAASILLVAGLCLSCEAQPERTSPAIVSLSPLGTRALMAMGLTDAVTAADPLSRQLLGDRVETTTPALLRTIRADLVLVPALDDPEHQPEPALWAALRASGATLLEVAPRDLDDAFALYTEIGRVLDRLTLARAVERRIGDPIGLRSLAAAREHRPCIAVVVGLDPVVLAGGHSFETNVVELLGAESVTHDVSHEQGEEWRRPLTLDELLALSVDLVIVTGEASGDASGKAAEQSLLAARVAPVPVERLPFDADALWLGEPESFGMLDRWGEAIERARLGGLARHAGGGDPSCARGLSRRQG